MAQIPTNVRHSFILQSFENLSSGESLLIHGEEDLQFIVKAIEEKYKHHCQIEIYNQGLMNGVCVWLSSRPLVVVVTVINKIFDQLNSKRNFYEN